MSEHELEWIDVGHVDDVPDGRVKSVTPRTSIALPVAFRWPMGGDGQSLPASGRPAGRRLYRSRCRWQCWIRCPWHGWDFDPLTGAPPGGHEDTGQELYPVEVATARFSSAWSPSRPCRTVTDVMAETMVNWGVKRVFGMVGHSNLGLADAIRRRAA